MAKKKSIRQRAKSVDPTLGREVKLERDLARARAEKKSLMQKQRLLYEELQIANARLEAFEEVSQSSVHWRKWGKQAPVDTDGDVSLILVLTDWHVEERIDLKQTNGINQYTPSIAEARAKSVVQSFIEMYHEWNKKAKVDHIVVAVLGDMITGYIHDELVESNYLSPVEACLFARDLLCSSLKKIKQECKGAKLIDVVTCNGNHGRTTKRMRHKTSHKNSYEWGLYHFIAKEFAGDKTFKFRIGESYHNWLKVQGHDVRFHHGDNIRFAGGVGGLSIPANKAVSAWNRRRVATVDIFGHWHQFIDTWNWVSCGCLIGYSEFALAIKADYQPATQTVVAMSKKRGKLSAVPIFC